MQACLVLFYLTVQQDRSQPLQEHQVTSVCPAAKNDNTLRLPLYYTLTLRQNTFADTAA